MEKPISLELIFSKKIFRIPDYQRGYAWQHDQLKNFWEDLINLKNERSHYTGVLTMSKIKNIPVDSTEYWLANDHFYSLYHVVDGQQRLTTSIIFIQAFVDFFKALPKNSQKNTTEIYVGDTASIANIEEAYLFKIHPRNGYKTYKFGYSNDNPSQEYLIHKILNSNGGGQIQETFYTLNLGQAKNYFSCQIAELYRVKKEDGLNEIYRKLTKNFLFNEYSLDDEFDVFVAFETMNNRGKKLSNLELLKNRLIYLTTLFENSQLDESGRKSLRDSINSSWKGVYHQLGRNRNRPLSDDDFLRAHWVSYFKYSRNKGNDYEKFLLENHFTPRSVHELIEIEVNLEQVIEQRSEADLDDQDDVILPTSTEVLAQSVRLNHGAISAYVASLNDSALHWFNSWYPHLASDMSDAEKKSLDRLNRIGMGYFRPLVMVILGKINSENDRINLFKKIERFIFLAFRFGTNRSNYRSSEFYIAARALNSKEISIEDILKKLEAGLSYTFNQDGNIRIDDFQNFLEKKFIAGGGYYDWPGLRYTLFEYEQSLLAQSRDSKIEWTDFLKSERDKISIEHIYPQTPGEVWNNYFIEIPDEDKKRYCGSVGNLLLLSMSINASLQNDSFALKSQPKFSDGIKIRNGYADGSHSEIEVARNKSWGPSEIKSRGIKILEFMELRWDFKFANEDREKLLCLPKIKNPQ